jgi:hypothetical protein
MNDAYWKDKSGNKLSLKDMDQSYLSNCLRLALDNPGWRDDLIEPLRYEIKLRRNRWNTSTLKRRNTG